MAIAGRNIYRFSPLAKAYFDFLTLPSVNHRIFMDKNLFRPLVNTALSSVHDRLWMGATELEQNSYISLINPSSTPMTPVNSPVFTPFEGWTFDGITQHIDTNYNPATQGVRYTLDSAAFGAYSKTNVQSAGSCMGNRVGGVNNQLLMRTAADIVSGIINSGTTTSAAITTSNALFRILRPSSTLQQILQRTGLVAQSSVTSVSIASANFYIGGRNNGGVFDLPSARQYSMAFTGSYALSASVYYAIIQNYMTLLGKAA